MAHPAPRPTVTPQQQARRERVEGLIGLAAPFLDLLLRAGDRLSRAVGPEDDYYAIRGPEESLGSRGAGPEPGGASADDA